MNILAMAEKRDKKLARANKMYLDAIKLENVAIKLDQEISNNCTHPKSHVKLKHFTNDIPQKTMWLCKICYTCIDYNAEKAAKEKGKSDNKAEELFDEIWEEIPE